MQYLIFLCIALVVGYRPMSDLLHRADKSHSFVKIIKRPDDRVSSSKKASHGSLLDIFCEEKEKNEDPRVTLRKPLPNGNLFAALFSIPAARRLSSARLLDFPIYFPSVAPGTLHIALGVFRL